MPAKPMTNKQRYWLNQVTVADASDGSLPEYAVKHILEVKMLYQWKTKLIRLGLYSPSKIVSSSVFVAVKPSLVAPRVQDGCTLTLSNGSRIEFVGVLDNKTIRTIITSAGMKR